MKKVLCLILCAIMLCSTFAGCTTLVEDDKGAIINMYLTTEMFDFDPLLGIYDDAATKLYGMLYEGLTRINEKGELEYALMKNYKIVNGKDGAFSMLITLNDTKWSDGRAVQANDIVFAWKRILDPDFKSEACAMLYDVKNARAVKNGDATVDDLGIASVDTLVLEIEFDHAIDIDLFLENLASPALVPLRQDIVLKNDDWAKKPMTMTTNGPFVIKAVEYGTSIRLERNSYYYRDTENDDALDKYVIPYRFVIDFTKSADENFESFLNGELLYVGEIPLSQRAAYKDSAVVAEMLNTHSYYFNTTNPLFSDANVRKAMSMALDRQAIANIIVYAKPATGFIAPKVFGSSTKTTFRAEVGDLLSTTGDVAGAKSLLGGKTGSFTLTVRKNEVDLAVAEYVKGVWEQLGFTVTINALGATATVDDSTITTDHFMEAYRSGDFDVIAIDEQMLSTDAFGTLAPFALEFSGNGVDMSDENYDIIPHITGYNSETYNEIIGRAFDEKDRAARAAILVEAEKQLMEDMPIIPLVYLEDAYIYNSALSKMKTDYYGVRDFRKMFLEDYMSYKEVEGESSEAGAETTAAQ